MQITKPNILDVLHKEGIELTQRGRYWWSLCPFHAERTPSFRIDSEKQCWRCFGACGGGDVIAFVQKHKGLSFSGALGYLSISGDRQVKTNQQEVRRRELLKAFNKWCNSYDNELCDIVRIGNQIDSMVTIPERLEINGLSEMYLQKEMLEYRLSVLAGDDIDAKIAIFKGVENGKYGKSKGSGLYRTQNGVKTQKTQNG